jgi:dipeptide/tripeptide permease
MEELNTFDKIKLFCSKFRIALGAVVLLLGFVYADEESMYNLWFLLGAIPLTAGILKFCPICLITKKCTI